MSLLGLRISLSPPAGRSGRSWQGSPLRHTSPTASSSTPSEEHLLQISSSNRNVKGEDASATLRATVGGEQLSLCLVADGHGGADTGVYLASHVLQLIVDEANGDPSCSSLEAACDRAFRQSHESVLLLQGTSGATLTVCIINELRGQVTCANVGDSTAIIITSPNVNPSSSDTLFESEDDLSRLSFSSDYGSEPSPTGSTTSSACSSPTACRAEIQFSEQATSNSSSLSGSRKSAALPESECYATLSADHRIQNSQAERVRSSRRQLGPGAAARHWLRDPATPLPPRALPPQHSPEALAGALSQS